MFSALNLKFEGKKLEFYRLIEAPSDGNQTAVIKVKEKINLKINFKE